MIKATVEFALHNRLLILSVGMVSFRSLLADLATLTINQIQPGNASSPSFHKLTNPTPIQKKSFSLLGIKLQHPKA